MNDKRNGIVIIASDFLAIETNQLKTPEKP